MFLFSSHPGRANNRSVSRINQRSRRFLLETLETRQMLSTLVVTSASDSGAGSLRQAIITSNSNTTATADTIDFQIAGGGVQTINLLSALPAITRPVVIDGTSQPGYSTPVVVLDGAQAGKTATGLDFTATAAGSTIKGLAIDSFGGGGVLVSGGSKNTITADRIGINATGSPAGNGGFGVELVGEATGVVVSGDLISANAGP